MSTPHPSRLDVERLSAGLLEQSERTLVEEHLEACAECREYFDALETARSSLHAEMPPGVFAEQVFDRASNLRRSWRRPLTIWLGGGLALATTAALILIVAIPSPPPDENHRYQLMGGAAVRVFLGRAGTNGGDVTLYTPSTELHVGDALRFEVTVDEESNVALIATSSGDEEPVVLSPEGLSSIRVQPGQLVLPGSVEITEDPEPVRLLLILREEPFEQELIVQEIHETRDGRSIESWDGADVDGVVWTTIIVPEGP